MNREEFETLFLILYKKWKKWDKQTCAYGVGWDIWQEQQKIIDELKADNPDVPCPAGCDEDGQLWLWDGRHCICPVCKGKTTVPLTKAQEYRIKKLEREMAKLKSEIGCINSKPKISENITSGKWTDRMIEEAR